MQSLLILAVKSRLHCIQIFMTFFMFNYYKSSMLFTWDFTYLAHLPIHCQHLNLITQLAQSSHFLGVWHLSVLPISLKVILLSFHTFIWSIQLLLWCQAATMKGMGKISQKSNENYNTAENKSWNKTMHIFMTPLIARFMRPTWDPSGADRTQVGPMFAPWTLLSWTYSQLW